MNRGLVTGTALLALAFGVRLVRLGAESLWTDEAFSVWLASKDFGAIYGPATGDIHGPLYYYLLAVWGRLAGFSEFSARWLSLAAGVTLVALLWALAQRLLGGPAPAWATLLAALAPPLVAYSQEARMYLPETALVTAGTYAFLRLWPATSGGIANKLPPDAPPGAPASRLPPASAGAPGEVPVTSIRGERTRPLWAAYILLNASALYLDHFPALVLIAQDLVVAGWAFGRRFGIGRTGKGKAAAVRGWVGRLALAQLAVAFLYLPGVFDGFRQLSGHFDPKLVPPTWPEYLGRALGFLALGPAADLAGRAALVAGLLGAGAAMAVAGGLWRPRGALVIAGLFALPLGLLGLAVTTRAIFHPRYTLVFSPWFILLLALGLLGLGRLRRPLAVVGAAALLGAFGLGLAAFFDDPALAKDDSRGVAAYLASAAGPEDIVLWDTPGPLDHYYHGAAPGAYFFVDVETGAERLAAFAAGRRRVFWVTWRQSDTDPRGFVDFLLRRSGHALPGRDFRGFHVAAFELSPGGRIEPVVFTPVEAHFGDGLVLRGQNVRTAEDGAGARLAVGLAWEAARPPGRDLKWTLRVRDAAGETVGQQDGPLLNDLHAYSGAWRAGERTQSFAVPELPGVPPGRYRLELGVYGAADGRLLPTSGGELFDLGEVALGPDRTTPDEALPVDARRLIPPVELGGGRLVAVGPLRPAEAAPGQEVRLDVYARGPAEGLSVRAGMVAFAADPAPSVPEGALLRRTWRARVPPDAAGPMEVRVEAGEASFAAGSVSVRPIERVSRLPAEARPAEARFLRTAQLAGYLLDDRAWPAAGPLSLTLYWRPMVTPERRLTVFVHLVGPNGIVAQDDAEPAGGERPTPGWLPGEIIADRHILRVSPVPLGDYQLYVGLYDAATGARVPIEGTADGRFALGPRLTVPR